MSALRKLIIPFLLFFQMISSESSNFECSPSGSTGKIVFKEQSVNLLHKIEDLHEEIEGNKLNKFRNFLNEISTMEETVDKESKEKRELYSKLMQHITQLGQETEDESHADDKLRVQIQNKL